MLLYGYFMYQPWLGKAQLTEARTQLLTAMILMELANAISARSLKYPVWEVGVFKNKFLWYAVLSSFGLQMFVLYTPGIQTLFGVTSPEPIDWAFAILFTAIAFGALEIGKYIATKRRKEQPRKT
jgi:Ca2+-transporting ATPase